MPKVGEVLERACPDCGADMILRNSRYGLFYGCSQFPKCDTAHGAHPDGKPLGIPANRATREARIRAHAAFDVMWRERTDVPKKKARSQAYSWLQKALGWPIAPHIGAMNAAQCDEVVRLCAAREGVGEE
jgi:hypothetical protein